MDRYAIVDTTTNLVVNVVVWDGVSEWTPGEGRIAIQSDDAEVGWEWNGQTTLLPTDTV